MSDIPLPPDSGVTGSQVAGGAPSIPEIVSPLSSNRMAAAIEGIATTRPRSFGGDASAALLTGSFLQLSHDLEVARADTKDKEAEIKKLNSELTDCKVNIGVIEAKLQAVEKSARTQQICIFFGTVLLNLAIDLFKNTMIPTALITGLSGFSLLLFGAFGSRLGGKK